MLLTRCPSCRTTFRITTEALEKADGQVRCGRCTRVFNAHEQLREEADVALPAQAAGGGAGSEPAETPMPGASAVEPSEPDAPDAGTAEGAAAPADDLPAWLPGATPVPQRPRSRWWAAAAAAAVLVLAGQVVHHHRTALAGTALVGGALQRAYAMLGMNLHPQWNVDQYRVLDWSAAAQPRANEGSLVITARIRNTGPAAQPFPLVHLQLQDRWQDTVGSRVFSPAEYLNARPAPGALMQAGDTTDAKLEIVDPGSDAYGFELDVCIETDSAQLRCAGDAVFR